jgi:hypothetical protein
MCAQIEEGGAKKNIDAATNQLYASVMDSSYRCIDGRNCCEHCLNDARNPAETWTLMSTTGVAYTGSAIKAECAQFHQVLPLEHEDWVRFMDKWDPALNRPSKFKSLASATSR